MKRFNPFYHYGLFFLGGYINALTIMTFGRNVGVQTGNLTTMMISLGNGDFTMAISLLITIVSFILGSATIGYLSANEMSQELRAHKLAWFHGIFALIFFIAILFPLNSSVILNLLSFYLGMQNGLPYPNYNNRMRTTSMTGLVTGIGLKMGSIAYNKDRKAFYATVSSVKNLLIFMIGALFASLLLTFTTLNLLVVPIILELLLCGYLYSQKKRFA